MKELNCIEGKSSNSNSLDWYRFGFNGQEKDDEITGVTGSHLDFGARVYDSRIGRWLSVDPLMSQFPEQSPYNFVYNDVVRKKDIGGKYGSDGHYWTVYALGISLGLSNEQSIKLAVYAEAYDNYVSNTGSIQNTSFKDRYTWANPGLQGVMHGLTGGSQREVNSSSRRQIASGNYFAFHLFGDSYAHASKGSGYSEMYPTGPGHMNPEGLKEDPDNIGKHKEQYMTYVNDLAKIISSLSGVDNQFNKEVFDELSNYEDVDVRTNILKGFIASKEGQEFKTDYSSDLIHAYDKLGIKYSFEQKNEGELDLYIKIQAND